MSQNRLPLRLQKEILRLLLRRSVTPRVQVKPSHVEGAGRGVFTNHAIDKDCALCLYAGVFTPGLPLIPDAKYLGNESLPSGVDPPALNAYIFNTNHGYLDGLATNNNKGGLLSDKNPSACAHLVNHSSDCPTVYPVSFWWHEIFPDNENRLNVDGDNDLYYEIPNRRRCDGAPWFLHNGDLTFFDNDDTGNLPCGGAVFCAMHDLKENQEIYLDYGLKHPLPSWAEGWYK